MNTITIDAPVETVPEELAVTAPEVDTIEAEPVTEEPAVDTEAPEEVTEAPQVDAAVPMVRPEQPGDDEPSWPETEEPAGPEVICQTDETGAEFCWWDVNDGTIEFCWTDADGSFCATPEGDVCELSPETSECVFTDWTDTEIELELEVICDPTDLECQPPATEPMPPGPVGAQTVAQVSQGVQPAQLAETGTADALLAPVLGFGLIVAAAAAIVGSKIRKAAK